MLRLLCVFLLVLPVRAQSIEDATELLRRARAFGESTKSWRAEVVQTTQLSGAGTNLQNEIRIKIAAQPPLKMSRQNSGGDRTISVCDGAETTVSYDGHSYYMGNAKVTPQCDFPLSKFYEFDNNPASVSFVGEDHVRLTDGDRSCLVVRAVWKQDTGDIVHTMCIDRSRPLILRDVMEAEKGSIRYHKTTTFIDFESNPNFPPDAFRISIPPGAIEVKP